MLNKIDSKRLESAIKYIEKLAFDHLNDDICTTLAILYDYRREIRRGEQKQRVISQ